MSFLAFYTIWYLVGLVGVVAMFIILNILDGNHWSRGTGEQYLIMLVCGFMGPLAIGGLLICGLMVIANTDVVSKFMNTTFEPFSKENREDGA